MHKRRHCRYSTTIVLILLMITACAKESKKPAHKQIEREVVEPTAEPGEPTPESSAAGRLVQTGKAEINSGNYEKATKTLETAINMEPNNGEAYFWLAKANFELGDYDNAKEFLNKAKNYLTDDYWEEQIKDLQKQIRKKGDAERSVEDAQYETF